MKGIKITDIKSECRAYADGKTTYIIEADGFNDEQIEKFCTTILTDCQYQNTSDRPWYAPYYAFYKIGDGKYQYIIISPYLD